jgi:hypothetical protein
MVTVEIKEICQYNANQSHKGESRANPLVYHTNQLMNKVQNNIPKIKSYLH